MEIYTNISELTAIIILAVVIGLCFGFFAGIKFSE